MATTLILWAHALAALLFGALAQAVHGRPRAVDLPRAGLLAALALTSLWALAVAGLDPDNVSTHLTQSARSIAWIYVMVVMARSGRSSGRAVTSLAVVIAVVLLADAALALVDPASLIGDQRAIARVRVVLGALATTGALLLLVHIAQMPKGRGAGPRRMLVLALAILWGSDLAVMAAALMPPPASAVAVVLRGGAAAVAALVLAAAGADRGIAPPAVSRSVVIRTLAVLGLAGYAGFTALAAHAAAIVVEGPARAVQTIIVFGFTAALLAFASTPWLRAWIRVTLAKHLFGHRYDYRLEWQRFTATLGLPGEDADPLGTRIVQALADLTDSPAGLLLRLEGAAATVAAAWRWEEAGQDRVVDARLADYLAATGRIISLDAIRAGVAPADAALVPAWLVDDRDAWAIVPLPHGDMLIGAIVLARPPIDRALDWEDFDLLRIVGRQSASYLAEERAHAALADARRFDEFNRRFAFLMHDIKNVASQLTLVARNAERHADNPDFRADMLATLRDSAGRMTNLLARLGQHDGHRGEPLQPVDVAALVRRVVRPRRAQHPILVEARAGITAQAQPARLEQALNHLIQNAADASAGDVPVSVTIEEAAGAILIDIADQGCGMSAGFVRDQLFRPFASSKPTGFGIGAYEARQLVLGMGGTIEVDSREGQGTRFRIQLPAAASVTIPEAPMEVAA